MVHLSGSTVCTCLFSGRQLITSNAGDSRAILVGEAAGSLRVTELTKDHKPCDPSERKRIEESGGVIDTFKDEFGGNIGPQ